MSAWETSDRYHIVGVLLWLDDDCPRRGRNRYGCGEELGKFWCKFEPGSSHQSYKVELEIMKIREELDALKGDGHH